MNIEMQQLHIGLGLLYALAFSVLYGCEPEVCRYGEVCCGDGQLQHGEVCDDAEGNSDAWGLHPKCNTTCSGYAPHCGDGVVAAAEGELCDDSSETGTCTTDCRVVPRVAGGGAHTCVLQHTGGVLCWGQDAMGAVGDGEDLEGAKVTPRQPIGLTKGIIRLAAGNSHTCAVSEKGDVLCWGWNGYGQLGNQTLENAHAPVAVSALAEPAVSIAAGRHHTCALLASGTVACWGDNTRGQLGQNVDVVDAASVEPRAVVGLNSQAKEICAGGFYTCALLRDGAVSCWGTLQESDAEQPDTDPATVQKPAAVVTRPPVGQAKGLSCGRWHRCVVTTAGDVYCWGYSSDYGQLGGTSSAKTLAESVAVALERPAVAVAAGAEGTCALLDDGQVACWGSNNYGQIGAGIDAETIHATPVATAGLNGSIVAVGGGYWHFCAIDSAGDVYCWGRDDEGQIGDGGGGDHSKALPTAIEDPGGIVTQVAAGSYHTCLLLDDGRVKCFGYDHRGACGDGGATRVYGSNAGPDKDVRLTGPATQLATGWGDHACALGVGRDVWCWGADYAGQTGANPSDLTNQHIPVRAGGADLHAQTITVGGAHTCAVITGDDVRCWGSDYGGQLGDGDTDDGAIGTAGTTASVQGLPGRVTSLDAAFNHTWAVLESGTVVGWGQLGASDWATADGRTAPSWATAQPLEGDISDVVQVGAGAGHACLLTGTGGVYCWGWNWRGQLGDPSAATNDLHIEPVAVTTLDPIERIGVGGHHVCAVAVGGGVFCWGNNWYGQLGNGQLGGDDQPAPVAVAGLTEHVTDIVAGMFHTCALQRDGHVVCWGSDDYGQVGDGGLPKRAPVCVVRGVP